MGTDRESIGHQDRLKRDRGLPVMSRLPMLPVEPDDPALAEMFAEVRARGWQVPNLYRVLGHAPRMLRAWLDFAWPLRLHAQADRRIRELLILRGAQVSGTRYEWVHHVPMALAAEVTRGPGASAGCIAALEHQGFGSAEITGLTLTASFYVCVSRFLRSMDVQLEDESKHG